MPGLDEKSVLAVVSRLGRVKPWLSLIFTFGPMSHDSEDSDNPFHRS